MRALKLCAQQLKSYKYMMTNRVLSSRYKQGIKRQENMKNDCKVHTRPLEIIMPLNECISNNGLLVRAITDILFYTDLIGTMVEIN